jgi:hypothetical protein
MGRFLKYLELCFLNTGRLLFHISLFLLLVSSSISSIPLNLARLATSRKARISRS